MSDNPFGVCERGCGVVHRDAVCPRYHKMTSLEFLQKTSVKEFTDPVPGQEKEAEAALQRENEYRAANNRPLLTKL
jgi:hypothetical protein